MTDHLKARTGVIDENPVYEDIVETARMGGLDFSINVTLDNRKRMTGVFAGGFEEAHRRSASFLDAHIRVETSKADIVVTTNGGYPLDRDLYQAVKGMTVGESAVRMADFTIIVSECRDGVNHPEFRALVEECRSPEEILETVRSPGFFRVDQWEAQVLARTLSRCEVICVTSGVEAGTVRSMHMTPAESVDKALSLADEMVGRDPEITVIPRGPSIIPVVPGHR